MVKCTLLFRTGETTDKSTETLSKKGTTTEANYRVIPRCIYLYTRIVLKLDVQRA